MNLLFVTSRLPYPPDRGDRVRTYFFLKELSNIYNITLVSLIDSHEENKYRVELLKYCSDVVLIHKSKINHLLHFSCGFLNKLPFQVNYYYSRKLKSEIRKIFDKNNIELIYTHLIRMAPIVKDLKARKILDYTDAISMEYSRSLPHRKSIIGKLFYNYESKRTETYEKKIIDRFDFGWFISKEDILHLNFEKNNKIRLMPNPVNIGELKTDFIRTNRIVFVGNMSVAHNISAVKYISNQLMPNLLRKINIDFIVIGANPAKEILALDGKSRTKVVGFVKDLYLELSRSDIFVAPMFFSAGVQNKVLEAMAVGLPVITSNNVAKSLGATNGEELIVCRNEKEYIDSILSLMQDINLRQSIGVAGYNMVKSNYSLEVIRSLIRRIHD